VDVLVANQVEAAVLSDHTGADLGTVGRALLALGPKCAIVTLGAGGVLIDDYRNGMRRIPAIDVEPVDTVGAGDCFCGAVAARLSLGEDVDTAARFACMAAGLATTRAGAIPGMPGLREVQERLRAADTATQTTRAGR
jgi:ribokinase